jgi:hypothetical protein
MKTCKKCNNKNIVLIEFLWAYDWILMCECKDCWYKEHISWKEIISYSQSKEYWNIEFIVKWTNWNEKYINKRQI